MHLCRKFVKNRNFLWIQKMKQKKLACQKFYKKYMLQFYVLTNWKKFVTAIELVLYKQPILFEKSDFFSISIIYNKLLINNFTKFFMIITLPEPLRVSNQILVHWTRWNLSEMLEKLRKNKRDVHIPLPLKGLNGTMYFFFDHIITDFETNSSTYNTRSF